MKGTLAYSHATLTPATIPGVASESFATVISILCLWAAVGLALTGTLVALGFGEELTQALAMAG